MKAVLFDLDNTLYPSECDLFSLIDVRINRFMKDVAAIDSQDVDVLRRRYWKDYGATLQGLIRHHDIDPEDYLDYVHSVDVGSRLSPDVELRSSLSKISIPSYVFTNGSRCHVDRVVTALGLDGLFADIFDIRVADYQPKPNPDPYRQILDRLKIQGHECIMVEDQHKNLETAKHFGMKTVLVGPPQVHENPYSYVDAWITKPSDVEPLLASWQEGC